MLLCGLKQTKEDNFGAMPKWEQLVQLALDRVKLSQEEQNIKRSTFSTLWYNQFEKGEGYFCKTNQIHT
jgi:hypothetical protein